MTLPEYLRTLSSEQRMQIMHDYEAFSKVGHMPDDSELRKACDAYIATGAVSNSNGMLPVFLAMEIFREFAWMYVDLCD